MTITRLSKQLFLVALLVLCSSGPGHAQQVQPIREPESQVNRFKEMRYPPLAHTARIQGAVVVQVKLDKDGRVTEATGLSGKEVLVSAAVENVKSWTFKPNSTYTAVVVYNFVILPGRCSNEAGSLFVLQGDNLATIVACPVNFEP